MIRRLLLVPFLTLLACDDTDNRGWLVDRTRVLGVRIEATNDASRAAIVPGERMRATWLVGAPNGTGELRWSYAVCLPVVGNNPEPRCEGATLATGSGIARGAFVTMELEAPPVADARELQLLAAFCEGGDVSLDAQRFDATCTGGAVARLASASIRLAAAGPNANPELAPDAIRFDGAPLLEASCARALPRTKHTITIHLDGREREPAEDVLVSHVVTAGELERQYSMLGPNEPVPRDLSVEWTAPETGRETEIFVVLRDGRGGSTLTRRTVCVGP